MKPRGVQAAFGHVFLGANVDSVILARSQFRLTLLRVQICSSSGASRIPGVALATHRPSRGLHGRREHAAVYPDLPFING